MSTETSMRKPAAYRLTLAWSMGLVALVALTGASLRSASEIEAILSFWIAFLGLLAGTLAAIVRPWREIWIGFALFEWMTTLLATSSLAYTWIDETGPTGSLLGMVADTLHPIPIPHDSLKRGFIWNSPQGRAKDVNGQVVLLTRAENEEIEAEEKYAVLRSQATAANKNCALIAKNIAILAVAAVGEIIGHWMSPSGCERSSEEVIS